MSYALNGIERIIKLLFV